MTRQEFYCKMNEQLALAMAERTNPNNLLDLRAWRFGEISEGEIFSIFELDEAYDFVSGHAEWYVDVYENLIEQGYAEFTDHSVCSE